MTPELLFEAGQPSGDLLGWGSALAGLGLLGFGWLSHRAARKYTTEGGMRSGVAVILGLVLLAGSALNLWSASRDKGALNGAGATVSDGCVADYQKVVHPNGHYVTDTYFAVRGATFHFNSSPWVHGFHDAGDLIHPGDRLRILHRAADVLRIERTGTDCPK